MKKNHSQICFGNNECREDLGLFCGSGTCACPTATQFWNTTKEVCQNYYVYGEVGCFANSHCIPGKSLICNLNPPSNQCNCPSTSTNAMCDCGRISGSEYFWDGTSCVPAKTEFSSCTYSYECLSPMICNSTSNTCLCPFTQYYNSVSYSCSPKYLNAINCSSNWTCRDDLGLFCSGGICTCPISTQFWQATNLVCRNYFVYGEVGCSASSQCGPGLSLICNTNPSLNNCTCPTLSQAYMCDCVRISGNESYWNGTICTPALPFDSACSNHHDCQTITKGLKCNAKTGKCYCMIDWSHYNGKCYRILQIMALLQIE
jgi:hypothetical protein